MRAVQVQVHNFRSIHDATVDLEDYSLIAGSNNSGKSNLIDAVRLFYGDLKWDESRDFPKVKPDDDEAWVEIEFKPNTSELSHLKAEYRSENDTFRVRNYIKPSTGANGRARQGYFGYENGVLSDNHFYGTKNVGAGKIGSLIYIPAVSKIDDTTKLTGPSAMRELVATVVGKVIQTSPAYESLRQSFSQFEALVKEEESDDGDSLAKLETEITSEIDSWDTSFILGIETVQPDDIVKTLVKPTLIDKSLGESVDPGRFGAGFQRHLVFTLIKLAAQYAKLAPKTTDSQKKEFSPSLTWILFEEPEAFLHASQEDVLYDSLLALAGDETTQILLTTHSSRFASRSVNDLTRLVRVRRDNGISSVRKISKPTLDTILSEAFALDESIMSFLKPGEDLDSHAAMAAFKTELWMQPHRAAAVFANRVVLVEGPSECAIYTHLTSSGRMKAAQGVVIVDCMGKYNLHRFISLFGALGIDHAVLYDGDKGRSKDYEVTNAISKSRNEFTKFIKRLDDDIEAELGIEPIRETQRKPQYLLYKLSSGSVEEEKIEAVIKLFDELCYAQEPGQ